MLADVLTDAGYFARRRALEEAGLPMPAWVEATDSLLDAADRYFRAHPTARMDAFLRYIGDMRRFRREKSPDTVNLFTIHSAKGLEFRCVFLMGLTDEAIPGAEPEHVEEERRLFYVGMTRAREKLFLSWSRRNTSPNGKRAAEEAHPCRFLSEIPPEMLREDTWLTPSREAPKAQKASTPALASRREEKPKPARKSRSKKKTHRVRGGRSGDA
jgi:DNA helicase-2/ATP-dependent DNA helicase PcrA